MYSLLIVDDEPYTRSTIKKICDLKEKNISDVTEAEDGLDAYYKICQNAPDIMILDMDMPRLDGAALLQRLSDDDIRIKVIVVSGHDDFAYLQKSIKYGVVDYLLKPVNRKSINDAIEKSIDTLKSDTQHVQPKERSLGHGFLQDWISDNFDNLVENSSYIFGVIFGETISEEKRIDFIEIINNLSITYIGRRNLIYYSMSTSISSVMTLSKKLSDAEMGRFTGFSYRFTDTDKSPAQINEKVKRYARLMNIVDFDNAIKTDLDKLKTNDFLLDLQDLNYYNTDSVIKGLDTVISAVNDGSLYSAKAISLNFLKYTEIVKMWCDIKNKDSNFIYDWIMNIEEAVSSFDLKVILRRLESIRNSIPALIYEESTSLSIEIKSYIDANYSKAITLNDCENQFNYSKEYMIREFKKEYGMSIIVYLNKVRMEKAKCLLESGISISDTSTNVGFMDTNYFSRKFKETVGMSPRAYIKSLVGINNED